MSAIAVLYILYMFVLLLRTFLEYIKILPVNKNILLTSTSGAKRQDPQRCKSTKLGEKHRDFQ